MNKRTNEVDRLKQHIAAYKAEISDTELEAAPLINRVNDLTAVITNAPAEEQRVRFHHTELRKVRAAKSAAYYERAELQSKIQDSGHRVNNLKSRICEFQQTLARAEYEAVSTAELRGKLSEQIAAIFDLDSDIDVLTFERDTLQQKRLEAEQSSTAVDSAERELQAARSAHDLTQGDAFISGETVDLSAHVDRIAKAEKHLTGATKNATAGRAALPRISSRLTAIEGERAELDSRRGELVAGYWPTRKRIVEIEYREQLQRLIDSGRRLAALDSKTGGRFGHDLLKSMREGLKQAVSGKYLEPVRIVDTDLVDILAEFESELTSALTPI